MLKRFAVIALALLPLAASAQGFPQARAGPGYEPPPGITVQGRGTVRYPVKTVQFIAQTRGNADEPAVLAAMRAAGVDDPVIGPLGSQMYNSPQTTLRGTVRDVSRAKLDRLARAAADYVRSHPGASVDNVNFFTTAESCAPHEQEARAAAIADAKRKAQAVAALAGVTIEGVAGVSETGGCPGATDGPYPGPGPYGQPLDLGTLTAALSMNESVTFSIVQGAASTRRRAI